MKHIVYISIILILSSNCFGQKDTIHTRDLSEVKDGTFLGTYHNDTISFHSSKVDSVNVVSWANDYNDTLPDTARTLRSDLHFDTVKVMMVYADTTNYPIRISDTTILNYSSMIQW